MFSTPLHCGEHRRRVRKCWEDSHSFATIRESALGHLVTGVYITLYSMLKKQSACSGGAILLSVFSDYQFLHYLDTRVHLKTVLAGLLLC